VTVTDFLHSRVPFLHGITPEQAQALAQRAEQRSFAAGQTVVFRGTTVEGLHVVASGKVAVYIKPTRGANTPILAAELGTGQVFGETSILESGTAAATVKAAEDETLVFILPQDAFMEVLSAAPELRARAEALIHARRAENAQAQKPQPSAN
jgi:CRP-like cAMP-binding protein